MILDTSFLIDVMNKNEEAVTKLQELVNKGEPQLITALSIFELSSGITRSEKPQKEKDKVIHLLQSQLILSLDKESAEKAGEIDGNLIKEGNMIGPIDCMIAGIALTKNDKVLTRNVKDFNRIKGLDVEAY